MRRLIPLLIFAFILASVLAVPTQAEACLVGTMDLEYNLLWPGPQTDIPDWVGTITIHGSEYGMAFFCFGSGKAFDDFLKGEVHFFEEIWVIYDWMTFDFETQELEYGEILLLGYDFGQTNIANSRYRMNGVVEEAFGDFAAWQGYTVHMSGEIIWSGPGVPHYAPGIFRINGQAVRVVHWQIHSRLDD